LGIEMLSGDGADMKDRAYEKVEEFPGPGNSSTARQIRMRL
jgi:hypothetical protein